MIIKRQKEFAFEQLKANIKGVPVTRYKTLEDGIIRIPEVINPKEDSLVRKISSKLLGKNPKLKPATILKRFSDTKKKSLEDIPEGKVNGAKEFFIKTNPIIPKQYKNSVKAAKKAADEAYKEGKSEEEIIEAAKNAAKITGVTNRKVLNALGSAGLASMGAALGAATEGLYINPKVNLPWKGAAVGTAAGLAASIPLSKLATKQERKARSNYAEEDTKRRLKELKEK